MKAQEFQRVLTRNIALPLAMSVLLSAGFVTLLLNLLSVNQEQLIPTQQMARANLALRYVIDAETGLRGYLLFKSELMLEPYQESIRELPDLLKTIENRALTVPQKERVQKIQTQFTDWKASAENSIEAARAGRYRPGADGMQRKVQMDGIRVVFAEFIAEAANIRDTRAQSVEESTRLAVLLIVIGSIIAGALMAWMGRKQLLNLSNSYSRALEAQQAQNDKLSHQAWLRTGQTGLSEYLRGDHRADEIGRRVVGYLAEYVGAAVGAIYHLKESGKMQLLSGVALPSAAKKEFAAGEGIPGRALQEMKPVSVHPVPADAMRIETAVSAGPAHSVIALPLRVDGEAQGVLEFGFSGPLAERTRELLEMTAEIAAASLRSAVYRARLQDLLRRSQELTEELQTQQEELRVSNEELSERTQALQDTQARLEGQHAELEQTNEQLEEQAQTLESQKKDLDDRNHQLERARREVEDKAREVEAASRYKSEFLANMSHELRTPLNSSLILAKLLMDNSQQNLTDEQIRFASTIYAAGNDLLNLINDILDLSKVEAGKLEVTIEKTPIRSLLQTIDRTFSVLAKEKGVALVTDMAADLPELIDTDRLRAEQVLKNLVSNAVKFTAKGSIELRVIRIDAGRIGFEVRDTGVGIEPSQLSSIFEAFRQEDGTISRKYGGTGLGLSISKNLAHLLGGEILVRSEKGKGSVFTLVLPTTYTDAQLEARRGTTLPHSVPPIEEPRIPRVGTAAPVVKKALIPSETAVVHPAATFPDDRDTLKPGRKILLIVEDDDSFAQIVHNQAHEMGYQTLVTSTAASAYELATRYLPSAVVLDMKLPDSSGLSFLDRLKANPQTRHIPVHGLSSEDYTQEVLHLGGMGHQLKPVDRDVLRATLERIEKKIDQAVKHVLIVEDDPVQRMSIEHLIAVDGVQITSVASGTEALAKLHSGNYDCMVIDLSLPDMSGFDLLENMSVNREDPIPPVIVYTGRDLSKAEEQRLSRYSRSIIIKGARSPERLLDEVTLFLHQVEANLSPDRQKLLLSSRNRERAFEGRTVLLADDDARNIFALSSALEQKGARVKIARNGREALERAEEHPEIDLILMDIMMPEMDGYEAIRRLRANPKFERTPIIAVTAKAMRDDYEMCLKVGANDYLAKPVDMDRLVSLMRVWLPKQIGG